MAASGDRKLYLGPRLRMLRRELGLNQTRMAEELGVSPSYLNHLERNQRPLSTQMLLRLAEVYDLDIRAFVAGAQESARGDLQEVFADEMLRDLAVPRHELAELAENHPGIAQAVVHLYRALDDLRQAPRRLEAAEASGVRLSPPLAWLRDRLDARQNHFVELDEAAEALSAELGEGPEALRAGMERRLAEAHGVEVRVEEDEALSGRLRVYDYHRRRLLLSEQLPPAGRLFAVAYQLAFQTFGDAVAAEVERETPPDAEAAVLARIALTNYAAAALVMPYGRFHAAAERGRYDLDLLVARFGVSPEQAVHRLTTLNRPNLKGVGFFMLKLDGAGNVLKRYAGGERSPLARAGGGCSRWRIHDTQIQPHETVADLVETPDARRYLTLARAVGRTGSRHGRAVVVLGCDARQAGRIACADALAGSAPNPIGAACHLCERPACRERALPPLTRSLQLHQYERPAAPYPFRPAG